MAHATDNSKLGYVTIATVHGRTDARAIAAQLEAAAIECLLVDERGRAQLALGELRLGEIKVQVNRRDVSRALQLLRGHENQSSVSAAERDSPRREPRRFDRITGWKLTLLEAAALIAVAGLLALLLYY